MSTRLQIGILSAAIALSMVGLATAQGPGRGQGKGPALAKGKGRGGPRRPAAPTGPLPRMSGRQTRPERAVVPPVHAEYGLGSRQGQSRGRSDRTEGAPVHRVGQAAVGQLPGRHGDYTGACLPFGLMRSMNSPDPIQFIQHGPYLALLYEQNTWFKLIPIDGRPHADVDPTWFGDSVGHWEGNTLVVNTNNFNGKTRLDTIGHPIAIHSRSPSVSPARSRPYVL